MNALGRLPTVAKDSILPIVLMRSWVASKSLANATEKISECFDDRPMIVDIDPYIHTTQINSDAKRALFGFLNPEKGYRAWRDFIAEHDNFIPCLQHGYVDEIEKQARLFADAGRQFALRLTETNLPQADTIFSRLSDFGEYLIFFSFDFEKQNNELLLKQAVALGVIDRFHRLFPDCAISVSATSFPESFVNLTNQDIFERRFFDGIRIARPDLTLVYGDRGSARLPSSGGGGIPAPRVDIPTNAIWHFFRTEIDNEDEKADAYRRSAAAAVQSEAWDDNLLIWGTDMIRRTVQGDPFGIVSPARSTAVRINIHLYRQAFYDEGLPESLDLDEDWTD